jgi:hypothetical protein
MGVVGPPPANALACVQWRERRERAAIKLAALADGDAALLGQAALLAQGDNDDETLKLLREAGAWTGS